jgi:O-acetyl-ADP-ribose deacetylase (regulator of RNase III)
MSKTIPTVKGDLFAYLLPGDYMIHGCNAQGVMGSGIALAVKNIYPGAFTAYRKVEETQGLSLGSIIPYFDQADQITVINGITQNLFGRNGNRFVSYDAITEVFEQTRSYIERNATDPLKPPRLFMPLIGAGLGGGNWRIIQTIVEEVFDGSLVNVILVRQ